MASYSSHFKEQAVRRLMPPNPQPIPRLQATDPNQVGTWDTAKLAIQQRGLVAFTQGAQPPVEPIDCSDP